MNLMAFAPGGGKPVRLSDVNRPSAKILIADEGHPGFLGKIEQIGYRHAGKANILFADFHVESMKREQLTVEGNLKK
jgi:prepilin-type processing-associated H-X9-DG protein